MILDEEVDEIEACSGAAGIPHLAAEVRKFTPAVFGLCGPRGAEYRMREPRISSTERLRTERTVEKLPGRFGTFAG